MKTSERTKPPSQPITSNADFISDMEEIGRILTAEQSDGLRAGEIADKWLGDARFSRELNARIFADELKRICGIDRGARRIRQYVAAYRERRLHLAHGEDFQNLEVSHLVQLAASRCSSDEERLELARRANEQKTPVRKLKSLAAALHNETNARRRIVQLVPTEPAVLHIDGLELLRRQDDGSIECLVMDWQWSTDEAWSQYAELPEPAHPDDPEAHTVGCFELAVDKLAPEGLILLHYTGSSFLSPRIQEGIERFGFKDAGEHIWPKLCGGFQNADTPLMPGHEKTIFICRKDILPKSCTGGVNSVGPRLAAPTRANSGQQRVHPHQKPVALYEILIGVATVNGFVVDLFAGSGSAGVAAVRRGCPYVGAELIPEYVEIANQRIAMAKAEGDEIADAVDFFLTRVGVTHEQAITAALRKSGLACVQNRLRGAA